MTEPLVEARGLGLARGGAAILSGVDFAIRRGEIVTVVGPNGSGKTSFLRLLVGAERPDRGSVRRAPGLKVGYVPQKLSIDHTMPLTVDRLLALAAPGAGPEARAAALARTGVAASAGRQAIDLSGGQLQRALLAQAILRRPDLLVLDEAAQGLDQPGTAQFYRLVEEIRADFGCAVLMVSHDLHVVMAASDRVICLNGHVCCEGTPMVVSRAPEYRALFGHGTGGALALYRHEHDHAHDHNHAHDHAHPHAQGHAHPHAHDHAHPHAQGPAHAPAFPPAQGDASGPAQAGDADPARGHAPAAAPASAENHGRGPDACDHDACAQDGLGRDGSGRDGCGHDPGAPGRTRAPAPAPAQAAEG